MKKRTLYRGAVAALAGMLGLLVCTGDYNPFTDYSNAYLVRQAGSLQDGDSLHLFSTETVRVSLRVRDLVDSVTVQMPGNRIFSDTVVRFTGAQKPSAQMLFHVSLYDTGAQPMTFSTYRSNGEVRTDRVILHGRPLAPPPVAVSGEYEKPVHLRAAAVRDPDVLYLWNFGRGTIVETPFADTVVSILQASDAMQGTFRVSDLSRRFISPEVPFSFLLIDKQGPVIVCVHPDFINKDTLWSGKPTFFLRLWITDRGPGNVDIATTRIDGQPFEIVNDPLYVSRLHHLDTLNELRRITVTARDHYKGETTKYFYIGYDTTVVSTRTVTPSILYPRDSTVISISRRFLYGSLQNLSGEPVVLQFRLNDLVLPQRMEFPALVTDTFWQTEVALGQEYSTIRVSASSPAGSVMGSDSRVCIYRPEAPDTSPPVIVSVMSADGRSLAGLTTSDSVLPMRVIVYDDGSIVDEVTVQGVRFTQSGDKLLWEGSVPLVHSPEGNQLTVIARDRAGHRALFNDVFVFRNTPPVILNRPDSIVVLNVGDLYTHVMHLFDADKDSLSIVNITTPEFVTLRQEAAGWVLHAWPRNAEVDRAQVSFDVSDGYRPAVTFSMQFFVRTSAGASPRFAVTPRDFPGFIQAGIDTVYRRLVVESGSGTAPFTYQALLDNAAIGPVLSGNLLTWVAGSADVGMRLLTLIVTDAQFRKDTLRVPVEVLPPNRPFTLNVDRGTIDTLADGNFNCAGRTDADTLHFFIQDPDDPRVEAHRISIRVGAARVVSVLDSVRTFSVVIQPKSPASRFDSLEVTVEDRGGVKQTYRRRIYYHQPRIAELRHVVLNTSATGANITSLITSFPLLIRFGPDDQLIKSLGPREKIQFLRPGRGAPLPYEIEAWDSLAGTALVWVNVDTILPGNNTQYLVITHDDSTWIDDVSRPWAVFDSASGFAAVFHLNESGTGTSGEYRDASGRGNDGKGGGLSSSSAVPVQTTGIIDQAQRFDGKDDHIDCGHKPSTALKGNTVTMSAWVRFDQIGRPMGLVGKDGWYGGYRLYFDHNSFIIDISGNDGFSFGTVTDYLANVWYHVVGTYDGTNLRLYINGQADPRLMVRGGPLDTINSPLVIGLGAPETYTQFSYPLAGIIDEVRVEHLCRDPDWIRLCYANQRPASTFIRFE